MERGRRNAGRRGCMVFGEIRESAWIWDREQGIEKQMRNPGEAEVKRKR